MKINPTLYITHRQIEFLVKLDEDELGRSFDEWVKMLEKHGWVVIEGHIGP